MSNNKNNKKEYSKIPNWRRLQLVDRGFINLKDYMLILVK